MITLQQSGQVTREDWSAHSCKPENYKQIKFMFFIPHFFYVWLLKFYKNEEAGCSGAGWKCSFAEQ